MYKHRSCVYFRSNNWSSVIASCTRAGSSVSPERWNAVCSAGAIAALCACVAAGGHSGPPAHRALLAAAQALPHHRAQILRALLHMDNHAYAHGTDHPPPTTNTLFINIIPRQVLH